MNSEIRSFSFVEEEEEEETSEWEGKEVTAEHVKVELEGFCMHFTSGLKVEGSEKTENGALVMGLAVESGDGVLEKEDTMAKFAASITEL